MCGIAGQVGRPCREALERALQKLLHRGPDQRGTYVAGDVGLAHTRLAVLDLSEDGRQPMTDESGRIRVVFNGEIYNHRELRNELGPARFRSRTDTEVLVRGYETWGIDGLLRRIRGMFAFGLWDERDRTFYGARDHLGKKPFVYAQRDGRFSFASTIPALLELLGTVPSVSTDSVLDFLVNTYIPAPWTIFEGVYKLPPASLLVVRPGEVATVERYWTPANTGHRVRSEEEYLEAVAEKLAEAVDRRLEADVPVGAFLSGGIDSSLVVALMAEKRSRVVTLSMGFEGKGNELPFARAVARHFGTVHHEQTLDLNDLGVLPEIVSHFGEPFGDHAAVPNWIIAKAARSHVTVVLTGDGGDELFGGYLSYPAARVAELVHRTRVLRHVDIPDAISAWAATTPLRKVARVAAMAAAGGRYRIDITGTRGFRGWLRHAAGPRLRGAAAITRCDVRRDELWMKTEGRHWVDRALEVDLLSLLPDDFLTKVDVTTMAHALEARSPFLDLDIVDLTRRMPPELKVRWGRTKYLLRKLAERRLPKGLSSRTKQGFSPPTAEWFRGDREPALRNIVLSNRALERGFFHGDGLRKMWTEHRLARCDHGQRLWLTLVLELWFRIFIDGDGDVAEWMRAERAVA